MIRAVENVIAVIDAIDKLGGEAGVTELAAETGLAKSTVHDHIETLASQGYIVRDSGTPELSYRVLQLGERRRRRTSYIDAAERAVGELAQRTSERAHYAVLEGTHVVFLLTETGETAVQTDVQPGEVVPLHATATGKVLLAHASPGRREELISSIELSMLTENTITDTAVLRDELVAIRDDGLARSEEEYIPNLWSASAPVLNAEGELAGALSVSAPASRFDREAVATDLTTALSEAVEEFELSITYD
jgi:DNA-binding IclR family transcriptional regulator